MESDDDFELLSSATVTSSPVHERKLKRLKKASSFSVSLPHSKFPVVQLTNSNPSSSLSVPDLSDLHEPSCDEPVGSLSPARENEEEIAVGAEEGGSGVKRALDFSSSAIGVADEELRDINEDLQRSGTAFEKNGGGLREEGEGILNLEPVVGKAADEFRVEAKERLNSDTVVGKDDDDEFREENEEDSRKGEEENHKKWSSSPFLEEDGENSSKRKTRKDRKKEKVPREDGYADGNDDEKAEARVGKRSNKKSEEKERRNQLKQLRVDSQRILRETRDASFKPIPVVHKPISSVLEEIRRRKQEISKKYSSMKSSSFAYVDFDSPEDDVELDIKDDSSMKDPRVDAVEKAEVEKMKMDSVEASNGVGEVHKGNLKECAVLSSAEKVSSLKPSLEDSKQEFRAPINDTQDLFSDSQTNSAKQESPSKTCSSPLEEGFAPSLLAMNLKLDSVPADDLSEHDEEDNDKENIDPHPGQAISFTLSPKGDHMKNFLDDEAEEEADSDNDPMHSEEIEEDEMEDAEELNEMITTNFKETGIDREKRNQLHQKWLEQQDAAGTEHLLQRLNFGSKRRETNSLQDEEDDEGKEEAEEQFIDEDAEDLAQARINLRRIKQMIPQMFTDKDDLYLSSDDEEFERRHTKQSLCEKIQGKPTLLSPAEDESTRDAFQHIKKLNIPQDTKKRAKPPTHYSILLTGGKMNGLEKLSFLGRASSSLPSSKRNKTSTTRLFVFGRDDSNSRGATLASEDPPEMVEEESRPTKAPPAKFNSSQSKIYTQTTRTTAEVKSSASLYDILRSSSIKSDQCVRETIVDRTESIFAAFRIEKSSRNGRALF